MENTQTTTARDRADRLSIAIGTITAAADSDTLAELLLIAADQLAEHEGDIAASGDARRLAERIAAA